MKNLMTSLCLLVFTLSFGQNSSFDSSRTMSNPEMDSFSIVVEVDSAEDLENSFQIENLNEFFSITAEDQEITLQIVCKKEQASSESKTSMSLKINGNTSEKEKFIALAYKIRKAALKYYSNE